VVKVEFFAGTTKLGEKTAAPWSFTWLNAGAGNHSLTAKATDDKGAVETSAAVRITINAPAPSPVAATPAPTTSPAPAPPVSASTPEPVSSSFRRAINLNGEALEIDGKEWQGSDASNYTYSGNPSNESNVGLRPATDGNRARMIRSFISSRNLRLALTAIPEGRYEVYLYVWETNSNQTYSITVQGKVVNSSFNSGEAGKWQKLGPYPAAVSDGSISVILSGGNARVSGIEVLTSVDTTPITANAPGAEPAAQPAPVASCNNTGGLLREYWTNVRGCEITDVPVNTRPTGSSIITSFEGPANFGTDYASRLRGYLCPPATGEYTFWLAANNAGELYLSTDENPGYKRKISSVSGGTNSREWEKYPTQKSVKIRLESGRRYYVEVLHKACLNGDYVGVGWQLPNGSMERPINGSHLIPFHPDAEGQISDTQRVQVFPNPASQVATLKFFAEKNQPYDIVITNSLALPVMTLNGTAKAGSNDLQMQLSTLPAGLYHVIINNKYTEKLMITR
jgi:hypothetical protein